MPLLVYFIVGWYAFMTANGFAAERVPGGVAAWLRSEGGGAAFGWAGIILAIIYSVSVRWPNKYLAVPATVFKSVTVAMMIPILNRLLLGGSGKALLILSSIVLMWVKARRIESARKKGDFLSTLLTSTASKPLLGGLVGVPIFLLAALLSFFHGFGLIKSVLLTGVGMTTGIIAATGIQQRDDEGAGDLAAIDGAVIGGVVGYVGSITSNDSLEGAIIIGIIVGVLAGIFVPGLGSAVALIIGETHARELQNRLGDVLTDRVKKKVTDVASSLGRSSSWIAAYINRNFGDAIVNTVAVFAVIGILFGVMILMIGREPVSIIEYNQTAVFPDKCPTQCEGKKFHVPLALLGQKLDSADLTGCGKSKMKAVAV
jgi:hypothetical protein